ncbi:MAG: putative ATP-grasp-modified RiPP [Pseudonocardiaceae bacterium]
MIAILGDDPLSSVGVLRSRRTGGSSSAISDPATRPLALCGVQPAADHDLPEYVYDPCRQIATDLAGHPLGPSLKKDWTSTEGTHTDGDGGDNESWGWEEV